MRSPPPLPPPDRAPDTPSLPSLAASGRIGAGRTVRIRRCARLRRARLAIVVGRQDPVERPARVGQDLACLAHLRIAARADDLEGCHRDLADQPPHLDGGAAEGASHHVPRSAHLVRMRRHVVAAGISERVPSPPALLALGTDQALVLELLQRRIDRAGAWPPHPVTALGDLLDDLISVHRPLGQQRQCCRPDVAAPGPRPSHPPRTRPAWPGPEPESARAAGKARTVHVTAPQVVRADMLADPGDIRLLVTVTALPFGAMAWPAPAGPPPRSEEHTSELQSHRDLHSFPTRRSSDLAGRHARRPRRYPAPRHGDGAPLRGHGLASPGRPAATRCSRLSSDCPLRSAGSHAPGPPRRPPAFLRYITIYR